MIKRSVKLLIHRARLPETITVPWGWGLAAFLWASYLVLFFMALLFVSTLADADFAEPEARVLARAALLSGVLLLLVVLQYTNHALTQARHDQQITGDLPLTQVLYLSPTQNTPLWGVMFMAFIIAASLDLVGVLAGMAENTHPLPLHNLDIQDGSNFLLVAALLLVVRPLAECLLFQGVVYPALLKIASPLQAIGLTALVFAVLHYAIDTQFVWWGFVVPLVLGLVAGLARATTKSNQTTIGVYMMFGLFILLRAIALA